jgi:hypothetical protein
MKDEMTRIQFDGSNELIADLDQIRKKFELTTRASAIRKAIKLLTWIMKEEEDGCVIISRTKDGKREKELIIA